MFGQRLSAVSLAVCRQRSALAVLHQTSSSSVRASHFDCHSWDPNYAEQMRHGHQSSEKSAEFYKKVMIFVCGPALLLGGYLGYQDYQHHMNSPRDPFMPYPYLYLRNSKFPWGDGNHSLFHHPVFNALPEGYEAPDPNEGKEVHH